MRRRLAVIWAVAAVGCAGWQASAQPPVSPLGTPAAPLPGVASPEVLELPPAGSETIAGEVVPLQPFMAVESVRERTTWFAGAGGLIMTRTLPSGATTAVVPGAGAVLSTSSATATWPGGIDLHLGRWFGDEQRHALELIYWGVFNMGSTASLIDPANQLLAVPQAPTASIAGTPADAFLAGARGQQVSRSDLVNDVEINWVFAPWGRPEQREAGGRMVTLTWLAGFRFFELRDVVTTTTLSGAAPAGSTFGVNGGVDQLALGIATNNNLYGGQIGGKADWHILPHLRLSLVKKFMLAGNSVTSTAALARGDGTVATFAGGHAVNVHATAGTVSYLGALDAALAWDVTPRWTLSGGYRLVGVGNIAQADQSWPPLITGPGSLATINTAGSTIVHGAFAGFEGRY